MWTTTGWRGWFVLQGLAVVACVAAWRTAADRIEYGEQVPLATISILGLGASLLAHGWVLQQGRRRIGARRKAVLGGMGGRVNAKRMTSAGPARTHVAPQAAQVVVAGPQSHYYHRQGCAMAAGRDWPLSTIAAQQSERRSACRTCTP